jgi:hypothetical protein
MEEKKLLRILIGLIITGVFSSCFAEESVEEWAMNFAKFNQEAVFDNFKKIIDSPEFDQTLKASIKKLCFRG